MQNPQFIQPQGQQFVSPVAQTSMDGYQQPHNPQYVQYQPSPMQIPVSGGTTSQVYPVQNPPMMNQPVVYDQPQATYNDASPLINDSSQHVAPGDFYNPGDNDGAKNMVFLCCGCGVVVILVSAVLGTLAGAVTGGAGCVLYFLIPIGMCMMCLGCLAFVAIDPNKDAINQN